MARHQTDVAAGGRPRRLPVNLWPHRHYAANTRWWPPYCLVIGFVAAAILVVLLAVGVDFH
jgi:hypothetical protein